MALFFPSMGEYPAYDDGVYDGLGVDDDRWRAYRRAIWDAAPGRVVLDIGTGRDALWAVEAAKAGARHVYAIEADPATAAAARQATGDRVTVITGLSTQVELPVPAEVCVSEIVGNIASSEGAIAVLADARARLCAPDCVWIPYRTQTWAVAVDLSGEECGLAPESAPYLESVFSSVGRPFDLRLCLADPVRPVSSPGLRESDIFETGPSAAQISEVELTVSTAARITGLVLWTRVAAAVQGREIDALTSDTRAWAPVYVPLSLTGVAAAKGAKIRVTFSRTPSPDKIHPDYTVTALGTTWHSPHRGTAFRATPFYAHVLRGEPPVC